MRFYTFVVRKYKDDKTAKGVLARSIKAEGNNFPRTRNGYRTLRRYLERYCEASQGCLRAFDEVWEEYKEHEGK